MFSQLHTLHRMKEGIKADALSAWVRSDSRYRASHNPRPGGLSQTSTFRKLEKVSRGWTDRKWDTDRSSMWMLKYREEVRDLGSRPGTEGVGLVSGGMEDPDTGVISDSWWSYCARRRPRGGKKAKSPLLTKGARSLATHCIGSFHGSWSAFVHQTQNSSTGGRTSGAITWQIRK